MRSLIKLSAKLNERHLKIVELLWCVVFLSEFVFFQEIMKLFVQISPSNKLKN